MKKKRVEFARHGKLFVLPMAAALCLPQVVFGTESDIDARHKAMQYLAEFAESICASVKQSGDVTKTLKSAGVKADLTGLTKKLADVGFEVKGAKTQESFEGVAQADLPRALESTANCKLKVIERFGDQLTRVSASAREKVPREPKLPVTGDPVIDRVEAAVRKVKSHDHSENELAQALAPLFSRPAFYGSTSEENYEYFLYAVSKTRLVLEENIGEFRSHPDIREQMGAVVRILVDLQDDTARLYGPAFSITDHIRRYIGNRDEFIAKLTRVRDPDAALAATRSDELEKLRAAICSAGMGNDCTQHASDRPESRPEVRPEVRPDVSVSDAGTGTLADTIWALRFEPAIIPPWDHCPGAQIKLVADHTMGGRCTPKDAFFYFSTSTWNPRGAGLEFTFQNGWKYLFPTEPMSGREMTATSPTDPSPNKLIVHLKYVGRE